MYAHVSCKQLQLQLQLLFPKIVFPPFLSKYLSTYLCINLPILIDTTCLCNELSIAVVLTACSLSFVLEFTLASDMLCTYRISELDKCLKCIPNATN